MIPATWVPWPNSSIALRIAADEAHVRDNAVGEGRVGRDAGIDDGNADAPAVHGRDAE